MTSRPVTKPTKAREVSPAPKAKPAAKAKPKAKVREVSPPPTKPTTAKPKPKTVPRAKSSPEDDVEVDPKEVAFLKLFIKTNRKTLETTTTYGVLKKAIRAKFPQSTLLKNRTVLRDVAVDEVAKYVEASE